MFAWFALCSARRDDPPVAAFCWPFTSTLTAVIAASCGGPIDAISTTSQPTCAFALCTIPFCHVIADSISVVRSWLRSGSIPDGVSVALHSCPKSLIS